MPTYNQASPSMAAWYIARVDSLFCRVIYFLCVFSMVFGLAFTLSLDDYVISKFINGDVQTISTMIYSATKKGIPAVWRAVSSLIFVVILVMLIIMNMAKRKKEDK